MVVCPRGLWSPTLGARGPWYGQKYKKGSYDISHIPASTYICTPPQSVTLPHIRTRLNCLSFKIPQQPCEVPCNACSPLRPACLIRYVPCFLSRCHVPLTDGRREPQTPPRQAIFSCRMTEPSIGVPMHRARCSVQKRGELAGV